MGMSRCPQCNAPMTNEETETGACPMCGAPIERQAPAAVKVPAHMQAPSSPGLVRSLLFAVGGTLFFCFLPIGIMFYQNLPETPQEKKSGGDDEKKASPKEARAEVKKQPAPDKKPPKDGDKETKSTIEKKPEKEPDPKPEAKKPEEKKIEEKKIEVKPKVEEKKIEAPKEKKIEKKPEPMPMPAPAANARLVTLPWLKDDTIKIDGDLADWQGIAPIVLMALERGKPTRNVVRVPRTMNAYAAWCSKGILIAAEVVDTSGALENVGKVPKKMWPFWDNDALEIYIDTMNVRAAKRGSLHEHQFFALPFGAPGEAGMGGYESYNLKTTWSIISFPEATLPKAARKTADGWTIELMIPMSALRQANLKPGSVIGFELQVDTGTNVWYHWAHEDARIQASTHPSTWGEALLGGSNAKIEFLDKDLKAVPALISGQNLVVRVADADANLNPDVKERLNVTLITKSGRTPLTLEETEPNSGVFVGQIETQRNASRRTMLSVVVGETITLEYVDRLRANGERDKLLRADLPCR